MPISCRCFLDKETPAVKQIIFPLSTPHVVASKSPNSTICPIEYLPEPNRISPSKLIPEDLM